MQQLESKHKKIQHVNHLCLKVLNLQTWLKVFSHFFKAAGAQV